MLDNRKVRPYEVASTQLAQTVKHSFCCSCLFFLKLFTKTTGEGHFNNIFVPKCSQISATLSKMMQ